MIEYLAKGMAYGLARYGLIQIEDVELYVLGFDVILSTAETTICILAMGLFLNDGIGAALFLICFAHIRNFSGGYHASTRIRCFLVSAVCYLASYLLAGWMAKNTGYFSMAVIGCLLLMAIVVFYKKAPIEHPNKRLPEEVKGRNRIRMFGALGFWLLVSVPVFYWKRKLALQIFATIEIIALLILLARRNSHEKD